jgi:phosphohistidine phosphatase
MRHGVSQSRAASGRDQDRELTPEGAEEVRQVAARAKEAGLAPRWIVASPLVRAQQTARIAARELGYEEPILTSTRLTPESDPAELWAEVRDLAPDSPLLFVAHEPLLSSVASWMLSESRVVVSFRPASLVRIDFDEVGIEPQGKLGTL